MQATKRRHAAATFNVRFTSESGHQTAVAECPLWAKRRHTERLQERKTLQFHALALF
jgi:hypothetical protein